MDHEMRSKVDVGETAQRLLKQIHQLIIDVAGKEMPFIFILAQPDEKGAEFSVVTNMNARDQIQGLLVDVCESLAAGEG